MNSKIHSPPFSGLATFAKFPILSSDNFKNSKNSFGIIGIPYDMGVTNIPGTRLGPREIRLASTQYAYTSSQNYLGMADSKRGFFDINQNKWLLKNNPCFDLGDVEVIAGDPESTFKLITESIEKILDSKICPIILGGDHAITYPILKSYKNYEDITILHFDAHMDYWNPENNSIYDHSCSMWNVSRLPNIAHIYQFGIRGLNHRSSMLTDAKKHNITTITSKELDIDLINTINKVKLTNNIYISFDIDFFDPSIAPGTGNREQGGFNYVQTNNLLKALLNNKKSTLIGLDLVEINPLNDVGHLTSSLGARLVLDLIGLFN